MLYKVAIFILYVQQGDCADHETLNCTCDGVSVDVIQQID